MALTRFGISLSEELLGQFDSLIDKKGYPNRSEAIRDLIRDSSRRLYPILHDRGRFALRNQGGHPICEPQKDDRVDTGHHRQSSIKALLLFMSDTATLIAPPGPPERSGHDDQA